MSFAGLNSLSGSAISNRVNIWGDPPVVKKGLLKQQREKMWSRWKERYFILTRDYLHCFRRLRNVYRFQVTLSAMGQFIYKLRLANIEDIRYDTYRSVSRIAITVRHEATIYLRTSDDNVEALYHWFTLLQECICMSKIRRQALRVFNSSSEEDTTCGSDPSRFSGVITQDDHSHSSAYTLATSSPLSASSGQTEMQEIYKRVGSFRMDASAIIDEIKKGNSVINRISNTSNNNNKSNVKSPPHNQSRRGSGVSCGYYFGERPTTLLCRPQAHNNHNHSNFTRFKLPALDSMSDIDNHEINDIFESLPKRCANPTQEMEGSSTTKSGTRNSYTLEPRTSEDKPFKETSPSQDDSEDYDDIFDMMEDNTNTTNVSPPRCESRVTLRDFVKTPWRSMSACLPVHETVPQDINRDNSSSRMSAFAVPSRRPPVPQRSVSSFSRPVHPPAGVFGGRKVLPTPWTKNNPTLQIGKGAAFSRSNVIVCPSKLSADVTYLRRV